MNRTDKAYIDGLMEYAPTLGKIIDYCGYQHTHSKNQIELLKNALKKHEYKFVHKDLEATLNQYMGRLQSIKRVMKLAGVPAEDFVEITENLNLMDKKQESNS